MFSAQKKRENQAEPFIVTITTNTVIQVSTEIEEGTLRLLQIVRVISKFVSLKVQLDLVSTRCSLGHRLTKEQCSNVPPCPFLHFEPFCMTPRPLSWLKEHWLGLGWLVRVSLHNDVRVVTDLQYFSFKIATLNLTLECKTVSYWLKF